MNRFWEELDEKDLEVLESFLDDDMKYSRSKKIFEQFECKRNDTVKTKNSKKAEIEVMQPGLKEQKDNMECFERETEEQIGRAGTKRKSKRKRKLYFALAAVLILICGMGAAASYGTWRLPQPETYEGDIVKVKETSSYTWDEEKQAYVDADGNSLTETLEENSAGISSENTTGTSQENETNAENFSDEYFINQTQEILNLIGISDVDVSRMTVAYQIDEWWNREEAEVSFPLEDENNTTTITFDRETGYFLSADRFRPEEGSGEVMSDEDALAAARSWYEKLPYPQGYEYTCVNKICEDADWMYSFCRTLDVEINGQTVQLKNAYEEARITIDPKTGDFVCCNVFYVPLLDDHKESDVPLTEAEARKIADESGAINTENTDREVTAEIGIVHPNYTYTSYGWQPGQEAEAEIEQSLRMSSVTRLAWVVTYKTSYVTGEEGCVYVYVDLYTGEILGGDMTV